MWIVYSDKNLLHNIKKEYSKKMLIYLYFDSRISTSGYGRKILKMNALQENNKLIFLNILHVSFFFVVSHSVIILQTIIVHIVKPYFTRLY